ncbi:spore coat protein [Tumebacillus permanentifrigoris]|uniref:Spore coat protein n=1 Tax=Tumebacillus permanentifrigoris TaxID=378543 RepID=A0A316D4I8_9BACL|nr:spore coat protein [Tumebacillus permanentifrigoris]PWK05397.1 hypothetical protein C7459_12322 [Tumebacillus permanentifrigoris]
MAQQQPLAIHETMELHEALNFKTVCALKSKMMYGLAHDEDLKALLELNVQQSTVAIQALQSLLARSPIQ